MGLDLIGNFQLIGEGSLNGSMGIISQFLYFLLSLLLSLFLAMRWANCFSVLFCYVMMPNHRVKWKESELITDYNFKAVSKDKHFFFRRWSSQIHLRNGKLDNIRTTAFHVEQVFWFISLKESYCQQLDTYAIDRVRSNLS